MPVFIVQRSKWQKVKKVAHPLSPPARAEPSDKNRQNKDYVTLCVSMSSFNCPHDLLMWSNGMIPYLNQISVNVSGYVNKLNTIYTFNFKVEEHVSVFMMFMLVFY